MISDDRVNSFHAGQVWESPRGFLYRVEAVTDGGQAVLRLRRDGSGRKVLRPWDAVIGWWLEDDGQEDKT